MPHADGAQTMQPVLAVAAATVFGFALTVFIFYPGIWTFDARYVYKYIAEHYYGDWQSPVMTWLWGVIDPLAPGAASMFLLIAACYWLAFGLLALAITGRSVWRGVFVVALGLLPPAFVFVGVIWRDVFFAVVWLLAAALVFAAQGTRLRLPAQIAALALLGFGVLLRPNALVVAPILAAYLVWPSRLSWKRTAILILPAAAGFYGLVQVVYYTVLDTHRQNPQQSLMVFDLGGITHFTKVNQFPVTWPDAQNQMVLNGCYKPTEWDLYWRHEPCLFVMKRLEGDKLFGTPAISNAWVRAVTHHPLAYLQHRASFLWNFLTGENLTMWTYNIDDPEKPVLDGRPAYMAVKAVHDALAPTLPFRMWPWLLVCIGVCAIGWRRRETPAGAFAIGLCGTGALYVLSFSVLGVASDFRYGYFGVLAGIGGAAALTLRRAGIAPSSTA